ncbi:MAG: hypothetical protein ABIP55_00640 [Tepidisphaeraceae bacterium]
MLDGGRAPIAFTDELTSPPVATVARFRLHYHPFRAAPGRNVISRLTRRIEALYEAFGCLCPALFMWMLVAPWFSDSPMLCFALGVVSIALAGYVALNSSRAEKW